MECRGLFLLVAREDRRHDENAHDVVTRGAVRVLARAAFRQHSHFAGREPPLPVPIHIERERNRSAVAVAIALIVADVLNSVDVYSEKVSVRTTKDRQIEAVQVAIVDGSPLVTDGRQDRARENFEHVSIEICEHATTSLVETVVRNARTCARGGWKKAGQWPLELQRRRCGIVDYERHEPMPRVSRQSVEIKIENHRTAQVSLTRWIEWIRIYAAG